MAIHRFLFDLSKVLPLYFILVLFSHYAFHHLFFINCFNNYSMLLCKYSTRLFLSTCTHSSIVIKSLSPWSLLLKYSQFISAFRRWSPCFITNFLALSFFISFLIQSIIPTPYIIRGITLECIASIRF